MRGNRSNDGSRGAGRASRVSRRVAIAALGAGLVVFGPQSSAHAQPPQVTLYLNNYGQAPGAAPAGGPVQVQPPTSAAGAAAAYQGGAALAQVAAYQQYLLYLSLAREGALGPSPSPSAMQQYFTNGAAVTTVPSAGPASSYYANGSEATRLPSPPVPSAAASAAVALPPAASALPPYFWTGATPPPASAAAPPPPAPAPAVAPAPAPAPEPPPTQGPVMSFQEWLQSMGAEAAPAEAPAGAPELSAADIELPIVEPAETAYEVRPRATYERPEKARERASENDGSKGVAAFVVAAFAVGLLLGGLAMWRAGFRVGPPGGAASG